MRFNVKLPVIPRATQYSCGASQMRDLAVTQILCLQRGMKNAALHTG
jgi:hypothetical protein